MKAFTVDLKTLKELEGNLLSSSGGKPVKSLFLTSCHDGEGKTTAACHMAVSLATHANAKVLLIDGNFNAPRLHLIFDIPPAPGLSDLLRAGPEETLPPGQVVGQNLTLLPIGADTAHPMNRTGLETFKHKLDSLTKAFDYVILDGASVLLSSLPMILARQFEGTVFVIECAKTRWETFQAAKEKIVGAGGKILGVILNKREYYIPQRLYESV